MESTVKSCWALASTPDTMLFVISKEKLKLNITMEPETIYRYKLMVEKSQQRAEQMKEAIKNLKQILMVALNSGMNSKQIKLTQHSMNQVALVQKLELSVPAAIAPAASSTQQYPEIALAVLIKNMEDSLTKKKELEAIIEEQEKQNGEPPMDFEHIPPEVFLSSSRPKNQKTHKKKLEERIKREKEFTKHLEESIATGTKYQIKSDTPSEGKTNFLRFAIGKVRSVFEAENTKNRTNYSLLVTSRSEEIGQAIDDHRRRVRSDHVSADEPVTGLRNARSVDVDEHKDDHLLHSLRSKYFKELQRVAGRYGAESTARSRVSRSVQLEDSLDAYSRTLQTEPLQLQEPAPRSRHTPSGSATTQTFKQSQLKVLISKRVMLREDPKQLVTGVNSKATFGMRAPQTNPKWPGVKEVPRAFSQRKIDETSVLPKIQKPTSTVDVFRGLSQRAGLTVTKFEGT